MGILYVVATPLGNLEDLTFRAARILREVPTVVAEDPRHTKKLLVHLEANPRMIGYREDSSESREDAILERLRTGDVALVVDGGTPGIADPGPDLVARVRSEGMKVVPVPGPSALTTAVSMVSFARQPMAFLGFLPERRSRRERMIRKSSVVARTLVIYLPPHGAAARLDELLGWLGDLPAALCRELTKIHEEIIESSLVEISERIGQHGARGELTIVVDTATIVDQQPVDREVMEERLRHLLASGMSPGKAAGIVARDLGVSRQEVYGVVTALPREVRGDHDRA